MYKLIVGDMYTLKKTVSLKNFELSFQQAPYLYYNYNYESSFHRQEIKPVGNRK